MKAAIIAALVASLVAVGSTQAIKGSHQSIPAQIRTLKAQVRALQGSIRAMNVRVQDLEIKDTCLQHVAPITQYSGYVWTDGVYDYTTTALDVTAAGQAPQGWVQLVESNCIGSNRAFRSLKITPDVRAAWKRHATRVFGGR
jgi:outer membrane murein-binding lipoprotein Lpp